MDGRKVERLPRAYQVGVGQRIFLRHGHGHSVDFRWGGCLPLLVQVFSRQTDQSVTLLHLNLTVVQGGCWLDLSEGFPKVAACDLARMRRFSRRTRRPSCVHLARRSSLKGPNGLHRSRFKVVSTKRSVFRHPIKVKHYSCQIWIFAVVCIRSTVNPLDAHKQVMGAFCA